MPRMDGIELARHLSSRDPAPAVIFVTAYDQYAVKAFELSAVDYLLKPVKAVRLADALRKLARSSPPVAAIKAAAETIQPGAVASCAVWSAARFCWCRSPTSSISRPNSST
ncbi:MAG: response regulator [Rhodocyclaceae bacterium]|nr:response regulator [Rhodocyclaceae bacterium]